MSGPFLPEEEGHPDEQEVPTPWSFRIIVVLAALYLLWRLVEGVVWLVERL